MKILLTGAGGYVGTYLRENLSLSHEVISIYSPNCLEQKLIKCDLTARSSVNYLKNFDFDVIIHAAAQVPLINNKIDTLQIKKNNKKIDENIIKLAYEKNALIIYFSTCGLYNGQDPNLKNEENILKINGYYLTSKLFGEKLFTTYDKSCVLRLSSPYSPIHLPQNILSKFYEQGKKNKKIKIWGKGQREQDFINLEDCLNWIKIIIQNELTGIYNIASGYAVTTYQLAKHIIGNTDIELVIETSVDEQHQFARYDNRKIIKSTNYYPKHIFESIPCLK